MVDRRHTARRVLNADLDQRQTDHRDDKASDQRRQRKADFADECTDDHMKQTADQNAAKKGGQRLDPFARNQRDHDRNKRKRRPLYDGQTCADRTHADGLKQGRDARKQHRHLDQIRHVRKTLRARVRPKTKTRSPCNDDRRCHVRDEHRQNVLDAQRNRAVQRRHIIRVAQLFRRPDRSVCHGHVPFG